MNDAGGRIEIGRIGIAGAPATMRDGAAFGRLLDAALVQALGGMGSGMSGTVALDALKIRIPKGVGPEEIAASIAAAIADAARGG